MDPFSEFFARFWSGFASLTPTRKVSLLVAAVLTLASIGLLVYWTGQVEYGVLFSNLSSDDAGHIVAKMQEKKIPYKVSAAGDTISVPTERVSELRLEMATAGLPQGGGVGFEIFDTKSLGSTEFEQQLNYRRALQGELSRTINSLEEIQQSRVHLALPKESLFLEQQKKATASVTVKLKAGRNLRPEQVEGIAHLVASSVEGINHEDVIIVDSRGNILSNTQPDSKLAKMTNSQVEYQRGMEKEIGSRIQTLLENVVGNRKAVVRVSADMDFRITEKTEENYDPDSPVIRSVKRQSEKTASPALVKVAAADTTAQEKLDETINYEINRVVNKTVMPTGEIRKLSVAVLLDGVYSKNEKGVEVYQPRAKKDIDALEELVKKSAGINTARGDQVVVTEMPFSKVDAVQDAAETSSSWQEKVALFSPIVKYSVILLTVFAVLLFFVRPVIRDILAKDVSRAIGTMRPMPEALPAEAGAGPYPLTDTRTERSLTERDLAKQLADADSRKFAEILRTWLK